MSRIAVITGGASGIGLSIGQRLKEHGFSVILIDSNNDKLNKLKEEGFTTFQCDLRDTGRLIDVFEAIEDTYSHIDLLFNGVGSIQLGTFHDLSDEDWLN